MSNLVNISIDDVSPHPMSSVKVLDRCYELIEKFEDIKFSLFVPLSYWRTIKPGISTKYPLQINMFEDFCDVLRTLPDSNFEVCMHGFYHGIPGLSDNDEFKSLNYEQAMERFAGMREVIKLSNLEEKFKDIFRPPAWRMSPDSIRAARDSGIKVLALSPKKYAKDIYAGEEELKKDVVYYNVNPPFDDLKIYEKTEMVYHACEWDRNYLSEVMTKNLENFLKDSKDINFCFIEDLI